MKYYSMTLVALLSAVMLFACQQNSTESSTPKTWQNTTSTAPKQATNTSTPVNLDSGIAREQSKQAASKVVTTVKQNLQVTKENAVAMGKATAQAKTTAVPGHPISQASYVPPINAGNDTQQN